MQPKNEVITALNIVLKNELTTINQYFLHARLLEHQGFHKLASKEKEESIDEMNHADNLIKRIIFLGGIPNLQSLGKLMIGETPQEMLESDLKSEETALSDLIKAIDIAINHNDIGTQKILEDILISEEGHIDWIRQQLLTIKAIGIQNYLQTQI